MPSFDIVSTVDMQEVKNAVDQVQREINQRYDFKGSKSSIELKDSDALIILIGDDDMKMKALQDMLKQKLAKREVSIKSVEFGKAEKAGGDTIRQEVKVKQGLNDDEVKKINKVIKNDVVKAQKIKVNSQIQGDQVRVTGKKRDDLQNVMAHLKSKVDELALQFVNFRD